MERLVNCDECTLDGVQVPPHEPIESQYELMLVGQAPGKTEVVTKQPFTGDAGKMLYALLKGALLDKRMLYQTNLVSCKPEVDTKGNDREPSPREILNCFPRLKAEILQRKPKLLIALGSPAAYALTGRDGIQSLHGEFLPLLEKYEHEAWVLCCFHPSFIMRQRQWINTGVEDLKKVHEFFINGVPKKETMTFLKDPDYEALKDYLYNHGADDVIAFDTETTGLKVREDSVLGMSFSKDRLSACAVYFKVHDSRIDLITRWLRDASHLKCAQNGSFDCEILYNNLGVQVRGLIFDTRLAEQLLNSDLPTSLDHLRTVYTEIEHYKPTKREMKVISTWGKDRLLEYACWDAVVTFQVMQKQKRVLTEKQLELLEKHLIPLIFIINKMERRGVLIDVNELAGQYARLLPDLLAVDEECQKKLGISPHSPLQVAKYFNLKDAKRETFEYYIQRGDPRAEEMQLIMRARDLQKVCSTYLKGLYKRLEDNYVHTEYALDGTGTGRLASSNPNLQNIPEELRILYIAEPGHYLLAGDFKQLELWVGAILAPCDALLSDLKSGVDVHSLIAELIRPHVNERLLKHLRLTAKTVVFGTFYGRSARSIAIAYGVSIQEAEKWQEICFTKYPGLVTYTRERLHDFNTRRLVETPWGRVRHVSLPTQAFNTPVQSSASDVTLSTMLELERAGFDLRLQVHDEIVLQVKKEDLQSAYKEVKSIFERPIEVLGGNCFPATFEYGENWYEMTKLT